MSLGYKNSNHGAHQSTINSLKFLTDEAELSAVLLWLRSLHNDSRTNQIQEIRKAPLFA
jgi:hypothetical protein